MNPFKKPALFFFDVDGTLIDCPKGIIHPRKPLCDALRKLHDQGHYLFVASGRSLCYLDEHFQSLPFDGYVSANGAYVSYHDEVLYEQYLDNDMISLVHEDAMKQGYEYALESKECAFIHGLEKQFVKDFVKMFRLDASILEPSFDIKSVKAYKAHLIGNHTSPDLSWLKQYPDYVLYQDVGYESYDVCYRNVSKASGIRLIMDHLGVNSDDVYAFGDGENDIEMLKMAGHGIGIDGCNDEVKKHVDLIIPSVEEDGIVTYLKEHGWIL